MTKAERAVWAGIVGQAIKSRYLNIQADDLLWGARMGSEIDSPDKQLDRAIRSVLQSIGEATDCYCEDKSWHAESFRQTEWLDAHPRCLPELEKNIKLEPV